MAGRSEKSNPTAVLCRAFVVGIDVINTVKLDGSCLNDERCDEHFFVGDMHY